MIPTDTSAPLPALSPMPYAPADPPVGSGSAPVPGPGGARPADPRWVRPALAVLLLGTALLYLWDLGASGWANSFYSAAVQAGSVSWKAFFYGSSDASNFITVDKTPASLWVMELSARMFGVNAWSILVPQALEGVAAVWLLFLTVRRWSGPVAGLIAGAAFALTPVAVLMFRFNNPDALLVLLLVAAAYATTRALEVASARWLALAGALVGFGFLTKMLQALLVVPAFALVYLVAAPAGRWARIRHLLVAGAALVVAAGWWVAIVSLVPASSRPYIGGSQHNSVLELTLGYNGFGRLTGDETGSVGGGGGGNGTGMWGATGWTRLFSAELGGQAAWLLPAALILLVAGLWAAGRAPRTDRTRAGYLLWGGWLLVTGGVFSFMKGIFHPYYLVALAPAIAAIVGAGAVALWTLARAPRRPVDRWIAGAVLAAVVGATAATAYGLLGRSSSWHPWLATAIVVVGAVAAVALLGLGRLPGRAAIGAGAVALAVGLAAPAGYALNTATTAHSGSIPSAGPAVAGGFGGPGGPGGPGGGFGGRGGGPGGAPNFGFNGGPGGGFGGGFGGPPNANGGGTGTNGGTANGGTANGGTANGGTANGGFVGGPPTGNLGGRGGAGGLLDATTPSAELIAALSADASHYRWVAAAVGSNNAAGAQLATGLPVMAVGGFNGSDPSPTLAEFQAFVAAGDIHYFLGGGGFGGQRGGSGNSSRIAAWVAANFTAKTVGGQTVYDLTSPNGVTS